MKSILKIAVAMSGIVWSTHTLAAEPKPLTEKRVKELALEAILEHPEILQQAIAILEKRQRQAARSAATTALKARRNELENDPNAPVLGNPKGDVTVVEFFDYNCPYCKRAMPIIKALLKKDRNVRLVYREWPILSQDSVFASRLALASRKQGKYEQFHWALMKLGRVNKTTAIRAAREIGLDIEKLKADMNDPEVSDHISKSLALAEALGFRGTPSFVIGNNLAPGLIPLERLEQLIKARREGR